MVRSVALIVASAVALFAACDEAVARPCSDIPSGGCPLSHGVACSDVACEAVYACREGNRWELVERCPPRAPPPSPPDAAAPDDAGPSLSFDASVDAPPGAYGGPGCLTLQAPDCSVGAGIACGTSCCGCEDLYVCENGGWSFWGTCGDAGVIPAP